MCATPHATAGAGLLPPQPATFEAAGGSAARTRARWGSRGGGRLLTLRALLVLVLALVLVAVALLYVTHITVRFALLGRQAMAMATIPRPFGGCAHFPHPELISVDGVPLPLREISQRRQVVVMCLDANQGTPSASQIIMELLASVVGLSRGSGDAADSTTPDLHQLLLCCDAYFIILTAGPLAAVRQMQAELAAAAENDYGRDGQRPDSNLPPPSEAAAATELPHTLPCCIPMVLDEGSDCLRQLQLVGLDGRTVPAVFLLDNELRIGYRQYSNAFAGNRDTLEHQLLLERAVEQDIAQSLLTAVARRSTAAAFTELLVLSHPATTGAFPYNP